MTFAYKTLDTMNRSRSVSLQDFWKSDSVIKIFWKLQRPGKRLDKIVKIVFGTEMPLSLCLIQDIWTSLMKNCATCLAAEFIRGQCE